MTSYRGFPLSNLAIKLCAVALALVMAGAATVASADPPKDKDKNKDAYLALGDSVVFGYITRAGYAWGNANNFIGYPDYVGLELDLSSADAACPGETTSGFISSIGADNGCRPYRANFPLHVAYNSTQLDYATQFLAKHKKTKLVSVSLGANDLFLLQKACFLQPDPAACIATGLPGALGAIGANMNTILGSLRATGFKGVLMVVNYYSLDYSDPQGTAITALLNQVLADVADANGAVVADAYSAFGAAAMTPFAGGQPCKTGLLNVNPQDPTLSTCDVHPSQSGQQLLADTVEAAYLAARHGKGKH